MASLDLTAKETELLTGYMERVLSDLSVEISGTDKKDYREEIKAERAVLQSVFEKLKALG
jgi:hypothetical protein